jgi:anti-anti-sigma regulatory factor
MLMIVSRRDPVEDGVLYLEGEVVGPWVEELRRVCEPILARGTRLRLDLSKVSFVSREGAALLSDLRSRDARLLNCSQFIAEQLKTAIT